MKVSAFCSITNPDLRQDPWVQSIKSVLAWADEVVVIDGSFPEIAASNEKTLSQISEKIIHVAEPWNQDTWTWVEYPRRHNMALERCKGDWAIRFDVDYIFPDDDWSGKIRAGLAMAEDCRVASFPKFSAVLSTRFYEKGSVVLGINRSYTDTWYGRTAKYGDMCYPIIKTGWDSENKIPTGDEILETYIASLRLKFYNYDYTFKTKQTAELEFYRQSMAHKRFFGQTKWGDTPEKAFAHFILMQKTRLRERCNYVIPHQNQPSFIRESLDNLIPAQFGHSGWGLL